MRRLFSRVGLAVLGVVSLDAAPAHAAPRDLVVTVVSTSKKPVGGVDVVVGVKSFPGGKFEFHDHAAKTDAKGRATFSDVVPATGRYGVYAMVVAKGSTFVSAYQWQGTGGSPAPITLSTGPAASVRLRFVDDSGKPVAGVAVAPTMRSESGGARHTWIGAPAASTVVESGADGVATLSCFLPGEWVGVAVRFPGRGFEQRTFLVPGTGGSAAGRDQEPVVISSKPPTMPDREATVAGDARRTIFVTGPKPGDVEPAAGWGLVLVLPGGDGSAEFRSWVRERYDEWVDAGFVFVELVAPKWSGSARLVWPTAVSKPPELAFTTEEFADGAVAEVETSLKVDRRRVIAVSWSSSGPACWRMLTTRSSAVTGHLIAMSVFIAKDLEPLANGKQRPLFLLHSPQDETCPIALAERGRDAAKKAGLRVEWATYEGGHGWHGGSEDEVRRGLHWISAALR